MSVTRIDIDEDAFDRVMVDNLADAAVEGPQGS
jgi:hypothetical protein